MTLSTNPQWDTYCDFIRTWFLDPDFEALRILTANLYSHIHLPADPAAWIFIIGPSGTAKTRLGIYPYSTLTRAFTISDISPAGLFSIDKSRRVPVSHGLLIQSGNPGNAIWLFKDFTTMLSKDSSTFLEFMSRLREIHDGEFSRDIGQTQRVTWRGKITCHIAVTGAIESRLAANRDFGERFLTLRWPPSIDPVKALEYARSQNGHHDEITTTLQNHIRALLSTAPPITDPSSVKFSPSDTAQLDSLVWLGAKLSRDGKRDTRHKLISVDDESFPSRVVQGIYTILRGHTLLFGRTTPGPEELSLARRIVLDTIPPRRRILLQSIPFDRNNPITYQDLLEATNIPKTALSEELEVLTHTGVLVDLEKLYTWTKPIIDLAAAAGISTPAISTLPVPPVPTPTGPKLLLQ